MGGGGKGSVQAVTGTRHGKTELIVATPRARIFFVSPGCPLPLRKDMAVPAFPAESIDLLKFIRGVGLIPPAEA